MTTVRRSCAIGAAAWVALHLVLGVLYADATTRPGLYVLAMVVTAAVSFVAVLPLLALAPLPRAVDVLLLVGGSLGATLLVVPFLPDRGAATYASWPLGACGVCVAGLVLRGGRVERLGAIGLALGQAASPWGAWQWWGDGLTAVDALFLGVPPVLWLLGALGIDALLRQADAMVDRYWTQAVSSAAALLVAEDEESVVGARLEDLRRRASPLLTRLADGIEIDEHVAREAVETASALRDDLRARSILDDRVRDVVAQARTRGAEVVLVADPLPALDGHRRLIDSTAATLLDELPRLRAGDQLSCRVTAQPLSAVLVVTPYDARPRVLRVSP